MTPDFYFAGWSSPCCSSCELHVRETCPRNEKACNQGEQFVSFIKCITEVARPNVINCDYQSDSQLGIEITLSQEDEPLGTAGPIALAKKFLTEDGSSSTPFFVLNSDVISDYPFSKMLEFHKSHGKEGTICVSIFFIAIPVAGTPTVSTQAKQLRLLASNPGRLSSSPVPVTSPAQWGLVKSFLAALAPPCVAAYMHIICVRHNMVYIGLKATKLSRTEIFCQCTLAFKLDFV